jgi:hypothetical protein
MAVAVHVSRPWYCARCRTYLGHKGEVTGPLVIRCQKCGWRNTA